MIETNDSIEQRLARLSEQTAGVVPRADFNALVMAQVEARVPRERALPSSMDWATQVIGLARVGVVVATMAAAAVLGVALDRSSSADLEEALAYGVAEAFE